MKITTKLKDARQVAIQLASAPAPTSELMLADFGDCYLSAGRNQYRGGFQMKVVRRTDRQVFSVAGFKAKDLKHANLSMEQLVKYGTDYVSKFLTLPMRVSGDIPLPPTAFSNAMNNLKPGFDYTDWNKSLEWRLFVAGYNEASRVMAWKATNQLNMADSDWARFAAPQ